MTLGAGIFLSAIFLGCVFLYIKSDNKLRWRKVVLFGSKFVIVCFVGFILYAFFKNDIETFFRQNVNELTPDELTIFGIKPGDRLTDIQFREGKATKSKGRTRGYAIYRFEKSVEIWAKDEVADILFYACKDDSDFTSVDGIKCGQSENRVFEKYKRENVTVVCSEDVETRIYEIKGRPINFVLNKNRVIYIGIFRTDDDRLRPTNEKPCT